MTHHVPQSVCEVPFVEQPGGGDGNRLREGAGNVAIGVDKIDRSEFQTVGRS